VPSTGYAYVAFDRLYVSEDFETTKLVYHGSCGFSEVDRSGSCSDALQDLLLQPLPNGLADRPDRAVGKRVEEMLLVGGPG
jgi:hypothetical protein